MLPETVLLISPIAQHAEFLREILTKLAPQVNLTQVSSLGGVEAAARQSSILLTVLYVGGETGMSPRSISKLKSLPKHPGPILVLLPPEEAAKVRTFLRGGADEFWLLPMDSIAFPPRLLVLMEWGRAALEEERFHEEAPPRFSLGRLFPLRKLRCAVGRLVARQRLEGSGAGELKSVFAGKWQKIHRLGFGSFGEVWLVRRRGEGLQAVAKIPHTPKLNPQFFREAAILKRLSAHPSAVKLLEVLDEDQKAVIIEEYVDGCTLQQLLDEGMESTAKERAFLELLDFLAFAHGHKIIHRDLKPENIIITSAGNARLLDFGAAKDLTRKSTSSTIIGSRPYMAPEQISGKSEIGSDVWAMGVLLYTLATGLLPFFDDNEKNLMDMILECDPEPPRGIDPSIPEELEAIILKCLRKKPEDRYRNAGELRDAIQLALPGFGDGSSLPS